MLLFMLGEAQAEEATPSTASGEEAMLFQEIASVYGASKYDQKVTEAPSSVSIIGASEIKKYGYRTLADILRGVTSFYITSDRNYSYIGVRGFGRPGDYNSRVLLLIDGHRTNDNIYDQAMVGTEAILDVDLIDRVEVIRGPGSSLYGSNAFFAVINIITKRGRDLKGAEVSGEAGSYQTSRGRLSYGDRFQNGMEAIVSGTGYHSNGDTHYFSEFDPANPNADPRATGDGTTGRTDYDRNKSFFAKAAYGDFTLAGAYASRVKGIPTGAFYTDLNDPGNKTTDTRSYGDLKYEHSVSARMDLMARFYFDSYDYTGEYAYYTDPTVATLNRDLGRGQWWGSELKLITRIQDMQRLIAGAEFQENLRQDQTTYYVEPYSLALEDKRKSRIWAAYLQDEVTVTKSLILNAGVRYDHYGTFGGTANPRLALIFMPADKSTIKVLYGSAFRAPNDYELYYQSPSTSMPNPDLKPEKIKTYELVYDQYFGDHLRASVAGYYYEITDLINQTTDAASGLSVYQNMEEVNAQGGELELERKWANGLDGRISYAVQRTKDRVTGEPLSNSPEQMGKLGLTIPLLQERIFASIEEQYMGRRRTDTGEFTPEFFLTNVTLFSQNLVNRLELSGSINNLFDKLYGDPVSADLLPLNTVQQDGRSYRVKLTYTF